jgi:hypothetical protein
MSISQEVEKRVREAARNRCGYCLTSQENVPVPIEIEHIIPKAKGGTDDEENLCNSHKGAQTHGYDSITENKVTLFNPRNQKWAEHFQWSEDGTLIIGQTPTGRATVIALKLNDPIAVTVRRRWVSVGWHPPTD